MEQRYLTGSIHTYRLHPTAVVGHVGGHILCPPPNCKEMGAQTGSRWQQSHIVKGNIRITQPGLKHIHIKMCHHVASYYYISAFLTYICKAVVQPFNHTDKNNLQSTSSLVISGHGAFCHSTAMTTYTQCATRLK